MVGSFAACSGTQQASEPTAEPTATEAPAEPTAAPEEPVDTAAADKEAADKVAALIDAIYVQERTDETDAQCAAAKAAWDALTDAQKELVEGEEADFDYFGRDTGDASKDDPRNADEIGENELLVVSFGTSFNDSRAMDIGGIEAALEKAYPDWSVRRAFTAQIIINHIQARDGEFIDNMEQALERAVANGVKTLVIQPTHLMQGAEYDELCEAVEAYADKFETVTVTEPLLGQVGSDASAVNTDKRTVAIAVTEEAVKLAGYESLAAAEADGVAFVFMGHGTSHKAKVTYSQMQTQMAKLGFKNVFVGTVEGEPEETACENVINAVHEAGYTKVILRPLMVVAGDHANNDMAGEDEDSWLSMFNASGYFTEVATQINGLGSIEDVQAIYVSHSKAAILALAPAGESDEAAAARVAALIDAIYVQERTADTDAQCAAAKAAWDALTDAQKELVEGEEADPDYFGRDTGDASLDNPRNADEIGENELLVVSFGTSFNSSRAMDIGGIEAALQAAFPDWSVRRAFTAQIIINHVQARDNEWIDNMDQALERAVINGVKNLIVQPTHLMHGAEYDELKAAVDAYADKFESVKIAEPLLGEVGADATEVNNDKERVAKAVVAEAVKIAGYETLEDAEADGVAFVFMGHGTAHKAKVTYSQMQTMMNNLGYRNVFIGTVEGEPEETACEAIIEAVHAAGYDKVVLRPLMVVAGDHANNDMADPDDPESWLRQFKDAGLFFDVSVQINGLGSIEAVQAIYVEHTDAAIETAAPAKSAEVATAAGALADGVYDAEFKTDSSMFHVNEANKGLGVLTVKDGKMFIHVSLVSKSIVNLFVGTAEDAQKDGAVLLEPTTDTVTYDDGTSEEVYGFDIPVSVIGEEFDLAIIGKSGKWYDHKVMVLNPVPQN
ncbi:MAG: sirohydrochlorin cobaltochelatase [Clostridia bacterium]|nr:sirohydrochlorin cobaltochelatase [Clostridia bacterium]